MTALHILALLTLGAAAGGLIAGAIVAAIAGRTIAALTTGFELLQAQADDLVDENAVLRRNLASLPPHAYYHFGNTKEPS